MTMKLTLEDLEAMRRHYGIAQEEEDQQQAAPGARSTYALLEDLGQVGVLGEVGMRLERWAQLRDVPIEYALALREYLDQEHEEANQEGHGNAPALSLLALIHELRGRRILGSSPRSPLDNVPLGGPPRALPKDV